MEASGKEKRTSAPDNDSIKSNLNEAISFRDILRYATNLAEEIKSIDTWDYDRAKNICDDLKQCMADVYQKGFEDGREYQKKYGENNNERE